MFKYAIQALCFHISAVFHVFSAMDKASRIQRDVFLHISRNQKILPYKVLPCMFLDVKRDITNLQALGLL